MSGKEKEKVPAKAQLYACSAQKPNALYFPAKAPLTGGK
jgi:hypothetical protein